MVNRQRQAIVEKGCGVCILLVASLVITVIALAPRDGLCVEGHHLQQRLQERLDDAAALGALERKPSSVQVSPENPAASSATTPAANQGAMRPNPHVTLQTDYWNVVQLHERSRFECALYGAASAARLALVAGALGAALANWDESTSWWVAGAVTALGAMLGGTVAEEPLRWRVDYRWSAPEGRQ